MTVSCNSSVRLSHFLPEVEEVKVLIPRRHTTANLPVKYGLGEAERSREAAGWSYRDLA